MVFNHLYDERALSFILVNDGFLMYTPNNSNTITHAFTVLVCILIKLCVSFLIGFCSSICFLLLDSRLGD